MLTRFVVIAVGFVVYGAATTVNPFASVAAQQTVDAAFTRFWSAANPPEAAAAVDMVIKSGVSFDEALARLKRGRLYSSQVPRGIVRLSHRIGNRDFVYTLDVPDTYDPARAYQVRFQLHGGVMRPEGTVRGTGGIGALAGAQQIYALPYSWADAPWWSDAQLENLRSILDRLKRTYNVDENRVVLAGVSDGATGAYYFAMRETTPFASFLPLNGFIMILANPSLGLREELFPNNLRNKPFFVVNGGRDPLYPTAVVDPYVRHLQRGGVDLTYNPQPEAGHNTAWWPDMKEAFESFAREHPRDPHPAALTWETDSTDGGNRAHWLVIDKLGPGRSQAPLDDLNELAAGSSLNFGVRAAGMRITSVLAGTSAERFGFLPGDVVVSINDRTLPRGLDLLEFLGIYDAGARLTFVVSRDDKPVALSGVYEPTAIERRVPLFPHERPAGRVDLIRKGNTVTAVARGVAEFTLLFSPDVLNFDQPVTVVANGRTVFNGRMEKSIATLMKWSARDNDRTMLYGAEIHIVLP
jgi:predicted esterase